jgi:hypothetical protein
MLGVLAASRASEIQWMFFYLRRMEEVDYQAAPVGTAFAQRCSYVGGLDMRRGHPLDYRFSPVDRQLKFKRYVGPNG